MSSISRIGVVNAIGAINAMPPSTEIAIEEPNKLFVWRDCFLRLETN
jgi:hypothetical protein